MVDDLLYIPDFLKAPFRVVDDTPLVKKPRFKKYVPKRPRAKKWKNSERVLVHLADECPKIGSGQRLVWSVSGRTWVYLDDDYGGRGKLSRRRFEEVRRDD